MRALLLLLFVVLSSTGFGQNNTIVAGEKLIFSASYNMSGLLTDLAQVTMETSEISTSSNTLLRLKCTARTYSKWDNFFKINDLYESYVNPKTLTPYLYKRDINEGSYFKFIKYTYNYKNSIIKSLQKKRAREGGFYNEKKEISLKGGTKDLVSTIYHIRNMDIHKAAVGDSQTLPVIFDHTINYVTVKYLSKETISTALGQKECYKLAISINNSDVLKGSNSNLLWLTADANKTPVYAKFKVAIGSGELKIKSISGSKY